MATVQNSGPLKWSQYKVWPTANCVVRWVPTFDFQPHPLSIVDCHLMILPFSPSLRPRFGWTFSIFGISRVSVFSSRIEPNALSRSRSPRSRLFGSGLGTTCAEMNNLKCHVTMRPDSSQRFFSNMFVSTIDRLARCDGRSLPIRFMLYRWLRLNQVKLTCQKQWVSLAAVHFSAEGTWRK